MYKNYFKRIFDFIVSLFLLILLSPILLIVSVGILIKFGRPIFFKQDRPGLNEEIFTMYKFRTMTNDKDENGNFLSDELRITSFGRFLRSMSLDELPELINILKGEMSFVGPRPLLLRYLPYYHTQERLRSKVSPGLTGLAQISGRNALNWNERFIKDVEYVNNLSFLLDLKIFFKTIIIVLGRKDILVGDEHVMQDLDIERKNKTHEYINKSILVKNLEYSDLIDSKDIIIKLLEDNYKINFPGLTVDNKIVLSNYEDMMKYSLDGSAILVGAFDTNKKLLGFVWAYKKVVFDETKMHISHIVVNEDGRSSGIGTKLINFIEKIAEQEDIKKIELLTTLDNENTVKFYKSKAYSIVRVQLEKELGEENDNR